MIFLLDNDIPLNKMIYFRTITVIIRCVFEKMVFITHKFICMTVYTKYKNHFL